MAMAATTLLVGHLMPICDLVKIQHSKFGSLLASGDFRTRKHIVQVSRKVYPSVSRFISHQLDKQFKSFNALLNNLYRPVTIIGLLVALGSSQFCFAGESLNLDMHLVALDDRASPVLDNARVLSENKLQLLANELQELEDTSQWRIRVLTTSDNVRPIPYSELKQLWNPDERTIIVEENLSSPNILNFRTGQFVSQQLPRQFFSELQSRYGNQFYVESEGEAQALLSALEALKQCLVKEGGCQRVPGLIDDLYFLTLATSIAGGCVFGFAARVPPSGRVDSSWQWVLVFSPLWILLFGAFGVLPVIGRTSDLEPILKNTAGFIFGAAAIYLTPILGPR